MSDWSSASKLSGTKMVAAVGPGDISHRRDQVLTRYQEFKNAAQKRRLKLEEARQMQQFRRDADELEAWINEKVQIASDEAYKDRRNLQNKIQKHHSFEAEIAAHNNVIFALKNTGRRMIENGHFATEAIKQRLDGLAGAWERLLAVSADKRQKLLDAQKRELFVREADEVSAWISDRVAIASSEEMGKHLEHVELLQKKFDEFLKDLQANESRITSINEMAKRLLEEHHPDSNLILSKQKLVNDQWTEVCQLADQRKNKLKGAHEIQRFNRTVDETADWMNEKGSAVQSDDYGRDPASVQALQRKHEGLERDLDALEIKVQELSEEAERLRHLHPSSADQIAAKQAEIGMLWEGLKHQASKRGSKLQEAQKFQKFLSDHRDLLSWVNDRKTVIAAEELAKDMSGAQSLLQRHTERKGEMDAQEDSFKATIQFGQSLISSGHFASDEIKEKLLSLTEEKTDLLSLWERRKKEFDQCYELQLFLWDVEQLENWIATQKAFLNTEDEGDSLEVVEGLIKKQESFEKSLAAQEEKFKALGDHASAMIIAEHYAIDEIDSHRNTVLMHYKQLLKLSKKRHHHLQELYQLQQFLSDADEVGTYISDKSKIAGDEAYKDPANLEAKLQQHQALEAELQANRHRMESVCNTGEDLIGARHFASEKIGNVCKELNDAWKQLEDTAADKGIKLQQANDQKQFDMAVKDVDLWLDEVEKQLSGEDLGKDLAGVKKLQKKLALLETDIAVHSEQIDSLTAQAGKFVHSGHFDAEGIQEKQQALVERYEKLQEPLAWQKQRLDASYQLQQFFRDMDDEEQWIKDREPLASLANKGSDLVGVQNLQKKHNILMTEITNHELRIKAVCQEGEKMIFSDHYGKSSIQSKIQELELHWQELKDKAERRKQILADSLEAQQYFTEAQETELWMKDMEPLVGSMDYGKDEDMAEALLKKHEAITADIEKFASTINSLAEQAMKCKSSDDVASSPGAELHDISEGDDVFTTERQPLVKAMYTYTPQRTKDIGMKKGDVLKLISSSNKDWWRVENVSGKQGFVPANYVQKIQPARKLGRKVSPSPDHASRVHAFTHRSQSFTMDTPATESVKQRQMIVERKYANLQHLTKERKQRLEESKVRFALSRDLNELQHWITDKLAFVGTDEVGKSLEQVEALKKKFDEFQKEMLVSETRLTSVNSMAESMVKDGHSDAEEIQSEIESINQQWDTLVQLVNSRKQQLEGAHDVQRFMRAADETKSWMNEKTSDILSKEYGRDLASVQALQRKHEGLERDLDALEEKVKSVSVEAGALARTQPHSVRVIRGKEKEVMDAWSGLKANSEARKTKLLNSYELQQFLAEFRNLMAWVSSMQALVSSQELANDVTGAESLLEHHQEQKNEMEAKKAGIRPFTTLGNQLLIQGHYASATIKEKLELLSVEMSALDKAWLLRKQLLDQCLDLQLFNRDAEQAESWMAKREVYFQSEEIDFGSSLDAVEALIKKHEDFDKSLQAQEGKIAELQKFADRLVQGRHYAAVDIAQRRASVLARWARLKDSLVDWRDRLGQSQSLQQFNREADEADSWIAEKLQMATDESYKDPTNLPGKVKKHEAFVAEVAANKDRIFTIIEEGNDLIENQQCPGREGEVQARIAFLEEQWEALDAHSAEKSQKLKEANQERQFNEGIKDLDFWLEDMETKMASEDLGKDMAGVNALLKKHQLHEADIVAHEDRIKDLNAQTQKFVATRHFDAKSIQTKQNNIDTRYSRLKELAKGRKAKLRDSLILQQFFASVHEEEAWIKQKKLLVSSSEYGKDLYGVQRHLKNHQHLENELDTHESTLHALIARGDDLISSDHYAGLEIRKQCAQLQQQWKELTDLSSSRQRKLKESLDYQEFCAEVGEEEAWLSEKTSVSLSEDFGDSLAAVQGLLKKHEAFETDVAVHQGRVKEIENAGQSLIQKGNYEADKITQRIKLMKQRLQNLERTVAKRKTGLQDSEASLKFLWEADTVESWIRSKQSQLQMEEQGRDIAAVQAQLSKQETFEASLSTFHKESIDSLAKMKDNLTAANHVQTRSIQQRHTEVIRRWEKLQKDSESHRARLQRSLEQFKKVEELFLQFAKKASAFNNVLANIEEDLTDPVRCSSFDEVKALKAANQQFQSALSQARNDFKQMNALDRQIKSYTASTANPYTWFTLEALEETLQNVQKLMKEREAELAKETKRQQENEDLRRIFARQANGFYSWLSDARTSLVDSSGTLESQLEAVKLKAREIGSQKDDLKHIEELGAKVEEALIFDNKHTEHTPVSLAQQWDQLRQMVMRIKHNLEQQIQARNVTGVTEEQLREFTSSFRYFDKDQNGKLEHHEFKACLRSQGYELQVLDQGQTDPRFEAILDQVDPNRIGYICFEDYMSFMINKETDNIRSISEVGEAFRAIAADRDKSFVTREELRQALSPEQAEYCIRKMKPYRDSTGNIVRGAYDYKEFAQSLF